VNLSTSVVAERTNTRRTAAQSPPCGRRVECIGPTTEYLFAPIAALAAATGI